jgi:hypothetical protein
LHDGFLRIPKYAFEKCGGKKGVKNRKKAGKKAPGAYQRRKHGWAS